MIRRTLQAGTRCSCARGYSTAYRVPTIFAPATGRAKTAIAILRISGPDALLVWDRMTIAPRSATLGASTSKLSSPRAPVARKATLRRIIDPTTGEVLDQGIVLYFPPSSALTAQPTLELHTHGSPVLMALLLRLLPSLSPGFRIAEPGEFTRLAFEAGKLDLTEVEGIRDLVESDTESQRKLAARQADGQMRRKYEEMRLSVLEAMSLVEALIDFGEDAEISDQVFDQAKVKVSRLRELITRYLEDRRRGEIIREGIRVAIIGAPNAGKSSMLNWLAQREAAIVASTPGTTRDVIELSLNFHGFPVLVADTAGLRLTNDEVESQGIERALQKADGADVKICLLSPLEVFLPGTSTAIIDPLTLSLIDRNTLVVLSKADVFDLEAHHRSSLISLLKAEGKDWLGSETEELWSLSVKTGQGMDELAQAFKRVLKFRYELSDDVEDTPIVTSERHRRHLEECRASLDVFLKMDGEGIVFAAEELRAAMLSIGRITGAVDVEEVLGEIFRGFCVGK